MRRVRYQVAMSLDGYIAGPNGEADWIVMDPDLDFAALFAQFDTLVMGRKTFESMGAASGGGGGPFSGLSVVVASRTLAASPKKPKKVRIIGADLARELTAIKAAPGKDVWLFGGGDLVPESARLAPGRHRGSRRDAGSARRRHSPAAGASRARRTDAGGPPRLSKDRNRAAGVCGER